MRNLAALPVTEMSQVGQARRLALALVRGLGFNETDAGNVAIVVSEVATNLAKHATGGELLFQLLQAQGISGIEILALDKGPGIANVAQSLRNGYSTAGSPGTGLGAIARLAAFFDIHSVPGAGTALLARLWSKPLPKSPLPRALEIGAVSLAKPGEDVCGDAWATQQRPAGSLILIADGLGHGIDAAAASTQAVKAFRKNPNASPAATVEAIHSALRSTRGAAVGVAEVDHVQQVVRFAGVGNIAGVILSPGEERHMVSYHGIVGQEIFKLQEFTYPWHAESSLLVMHSDGLVSHWNLDRCPGLMSRHPSLIAGVLYRDYNRGNDDVTVVVARLVQS